MRQGRRRRGDRVWLRVRYSQPFTTVTLRMQLAPGQYKTFRARVDNRMILRAVQRRLRRYGVQLEIGFSFLKKAWKAVKKVGKKLGINKVLKVAAKALPIAAKFLPPPANVAAAGASIALKTGRNLVKAVSLRRRGKRKASRRLVVRTNRMGQRAARKLGRVRARRAVARGARLYRLAVQPL